MSINTSTYDRAALSGRAVERDARALLGQVMGYVAVTVGFAALGAYLGRDLSGGAGLLFFIGAFACIFGLNAASPADASSSRSGCCSGSGCCSASRSRRSSPTTPSADPAALWQAAGATAAFVAGLGAFGYATRRDLSVMGAPAVLGAAGLIVFGLVAIFVSIPRRQHHLRACSAW